MISAELGNQLEAFVAHFVETGRYNPPHPGRGNPPRSA